MNKLLANLCHNNVDIRTRAAKNLTFKLTSGLVLPERIISNVIATRSILSTLNNSAVSDQEFGQLLTLLELITTKDAWSAAVLVDAGALKVVRALMDQVNSFDTTARSDQQRITLQDQLKNIAKILLSVPPQQRNPPHAVETSQNMLYPTAENTDPTRSKRASPPPSPPRYGGGGGGGSKIQSPPRRDTKRSDSPDHFASMMAISTSTTAPTDNTGSSVRGGWCFPRIELTRHDDQILYHAKAELSCGDPVRQMNVVKQLSTIMLSDFPGEIWLQRPEIFRMLLTLIRSTKESNIPSDTALLECTVHCMETLLKHWKHSLKRMLDHELHPTITTTTTAAAPTPTSTRDRIETSYPSGHAGTIVFTPSSSSTSSISLGDAALMIVMSGVPTSLCNNSIHTDLLQPMLCQAMSLVAESFPIHHVTREGQVIDHTSWTASRYQTIMNTMGSLLSQCVIAGLQPAASTTTAPLPNNGIDTNPALQLTYCRLLHCLLLEIAGSNLGIAGDTTAPSTPSVHVSTNVVAFVRHALFCSVGSGSTFDIDENVWKSLDTLMKSVDHQGAHLMEVSESILTAVRTAHNNYSSTDPAEDAHDTNEEKTMVNPRDRFLKHAIALMSAAEATNETKQQHETSSDVVDTCRCQCDALFDMLPSLMCMRTTTDAMNLGNAEEKPVVDNAMASAIVGDVVALCGLTHSDMVQSSNYEDHAISALQNDSIALLVKLMTYPFPQVQLIVYEQLLSSVTMRTLSLGGNRSSSHRHSSSSSTQIVTLVDRFVVDVMVNNILNHELIMNEIVFQGMNNKLVQTYAMDLARSVVTLVSNGIGTHGTTDDSGMVRLHKYIPVLACLTLGDKEDHTNKVSKEVDVSGIVETMSLQDRALLLLQALSHRDKTIRHRAAQDLRHMSRSILSSREGTTEDYIDPRMLRQPLSYTADRYRVDLQGEEQRNELEQQQQQQQQQQQVTVSDVAQLVQLLESPTIEDSIWCTAADHVGSMLRSDGDGDGGDDVADECGAHNTDENSNMLLKLLGTVLLKMSLSGDGQNATLLSKSYELLLILVGHCTACYKALVVQDVLLARIVPDVFHANAQVRFGVHRLVLLLVYHPIRMVPQVLRSSGGSTSATNTTNATMRLVDTKCLFAETYSSSATTTTSTESFAPVQTVLPVLHLSDVVAVCCDRKILRVLSSVVQQSFVPSQRPSMEDTVGVHPSHHTQRSYMLRFVHTQLNSNNASSAIQVAAVVRSLLFNIKTATSHAVFLRATQQLGRACHVYPEISHAVGTVASFEEKETTAWLPPFRRILRTSPTCDMDRVVLRSVLQTLHVLVKSMNTASLFALSSLVKTCLLPLIRNIGHDQLDQHNPGVIPSVLRTKIDLYAHVGQMGGGKSEALKMDVSVAAMELMLELIRIVQSRPADDLVQQTVLFIACETRMLHVLSTMFTPEALPFRHPHRRRRRPSCRTDATYIAYRTMVHLCLCSSRALKALGTSKQTTEKEFTRTKQRNTVLNLPSVVSACVEFLSSSNFQRYNRSTLLRATTSLLCRVMKDGQGQMILGAIHQQWAETKEDEDEEDREVLVAQAPWYIAGCTAKDTTVRANVVSLSLGLETLEWLKSDTGSLFMSLPSSPHHVPEGVIPSIHRAMQFVTQRTQPPLVRAEALDAVACSFEEALAATSTNKNDVKATAIWLVNHAVVGGVLADMHEDESGSLRCCAAAARLSVYCTLVLKKQMTPTLREEMDIRLLRTAEGVHQRSTLNTAWLRSMSSLLRNTYCPTVMLTRRGRQQQKEVLYDGLMPAPFDVRLYQQQQQQQQQLPKEPDNDIACGRVVIQTMHSLWKEVHVSVAMEIETMSMLALRTIVGEKETGVETHRHPAEGKAKEEDSDSDSDSEADDYSFKYEEEETEASYEKSMSCAIQKLSGCWNIVEEDQSNVTMAMLKFMDQCTKMLCTLITSLLGCALKKQTSSLISIDFVPLTSLIERGMSCSFKIPNTLSSNSSHLLWLLLETRPLTKNRVVNVLNISAVTNVLVTQYMRAYTSFTSSSTTHPNAQPPQHQRWLGPLCTLLKQSSGRGLASEVACNMGIIYFALNHLGKCHMLLNNVLGRSTVENPRHVIKHMHVHYQILANAMSSSSVARTQCIQFEGAAVLQQSWSVLEGLPKRLVTSVVCNYLRVLTALTQNNDEKNREFVHHDVFGIPIIDEVGAKTNAATYGGAYHQHRHQRNETSLLLLPIRPVVTSQPASLMTNLIIFLMHRLNRVVTNIEHGTVISTNDMDIIKLGSAMLVQLGKDQPTAKVLSRMPLVHNFILLLRRMVLGSPMTGSSKKGSQSSKSSKSIAFQNSTNARIVQMCMLNVMLSMSTHLSEHELCFYSHNRQNGAHDTLLLLWRQWCCSSTTTATANEITLLGHLIRNLSMANKSKFMAHETLLEEMLESVLCEEQPIVVACAASILWSVSYNYKRIIPRMKSCNAALVFQRGLDILKRDLVNRQKTAVAPPRGASTDKYTDSMIANAMQGLIRLTEWCKTNQVSNRRVVAARKNSP